MKNELAEAKRARDQQAKLVEEYSVKLQEAEYCKERMDAIEAKINHLESKIKGV